MSMIVTHKNLPEISELEKRLYALVALYIILEDDVEVREIKKLKSQKQGERLFIWDNGSSDFMLIVFSNSGCIILGFAHEYCDFKKHPELYDELPQSLCGLLNHAEDLGYWTEEDEDFTFCVWRENTSSHWRLKSIYDEPGDEELYEYSPNMSCDFNELIINLYSSAEDFTGNHRWFREDDYYYIPVAPQKQIHAGENMTAAIKQIYAGENITEELIREINPKRDIEEVLMEIDKMISEK